MRIEIKPFDTLFFRDGKPFTMGENNWADGLFPPPPSVIYGALRATYFAHHPNELSKANQSEDPTKNLKINDISYVSNSTNFYPVPANLAIEETNKKNYRATKLKMKEVTSSAAVKVMCSEPGKKVESSSGVFFTDTSLANYLTNNLDLEKLNNKSKNIFKMSELILTEPKIGIGRDYNTKTSESGKLYRLGMKRLKGFSILVDFEGLELPENGLLRFGAEGKTSSYQKSNIYSTDFNLSDEKLTRFILYFSTPAVFKNGWFPDFFNDKLECVINDVSCKILSLSMEKPLLLGGWDMEKNQPKAMQKFIAPGTVYVLETDREISAKEVYDHFSAPQMCEESYAKQGYGLFKIGVYND
ncbi:MAG: type III-B CRISPR module-associated protein Cmr3 [bacterium]